LFKSIGKLIYSPRTHLGSSDRWLILACDEELSSYYRYLFYREFPYLGKLSRPIFGAHISIIRGELVPNYNLWRFDENKLIEFYYSPEVIDNGEYYWLKVKSKYLEDLRELYGLSRLPQFNFHLTIGRTTC